MAHIALVTYADEPDLFKDDRFLFAPLRQRGIQAEVVLWDDETIDWTSYDLVVLRSVWDYHLRSGEFLGWLRGLRAEAVNIINAFDLIEWNMDKRYLVQLAHHGIKIVPTIHLLPDSSVALYDIVQAQGWDEAVIKPAISASGDQTWRITLDTAEDHQSHFDQLARQTGVLVQRFMPEIQQGEWSLTFFNGIYSHAVLKRPPANSMFVHEERGGTNTVIQPPPNIVAQANYVLRMVKMLTTHLPIYARVDGLVIDEELVLMELECIEPELHLAYAAPYAAERFADAITSVL